MKKTSITLTIALITGLSLSNNLLADKQVERAIEYRQGVMNVIAWNFGSMAAMMKGKVPYDQKAFAAHANDLSKAASLDLLPGFPEDSDESDETDAKPDIWMDWEDFENKLGDLRKASVQLAATAASGDREAIGKQFGATGKTCKGCHKPYKN